MIELGRLLLAAVFAVGGVAKLADLTGSRRAVRDFGVPGRLAAPLGFLLPIAEIGIAVGLVPASSARLAAAAGAGLLVLFMVAIGISLLRGRRPDCHCFGQLHSASAGPATLVRNAALAGLGVLVASQPAGEPGWIELAAVGVSALVVGQAALSYLFLRRYGRALLRIEELESELDQPAALAVGAEAPGFALPDLDGHEVELGGLLARRRPVLLVFADPGCGPCRALLPELAEWQRDHAERLTIALISRGEQSANVAVAEEHGLHTVLIQEHREVAELYQSDATPSAVLVGADGRIAQVLATGAEAIAQLIRSATTAEPPELERSRNGPQRIAAAAALAGGLAVATAAHASPNRIAAAPPIDPELQAIDTAIKKATPRLIAAARHAAKAGEAQATLRVGKAVAAKRAAAARAVATERHEVLALRATLEKLAVTSNTARSTKAFALSSLSLLTQSLQKQERALVAAPKDGLRLLEEAQRLFLRSLVPGVQAGRLLGRGR